MLITGVVIVRAFDKQQQIMHGLNLCVEPVLSHVHLILITGVVIVRAFDKQQQMMYGLNLCVLGQSMDVWISKGHDLRTRSLKL